MCAFIEGHGEPVRHDFVISVCRLDTQLVELEELSGVGSAVVARGKIWLELVGLNDGAQLQGECMATCHAHWS